MVHRHGVRGRTNAARGVRGCRLFDETATRVSRAGRQRGRPCARNGIAHCDLKPDNIMVTRDGLVKVLDFGLARLAGSSDTAGPRFEGTIGYMSPEQTAGQTIDARSDVFSFGCVLFEAVTGRLPFPAPRWFDSLMKDPPPRLETLAPEAPDGVQALIDDCLVKDPATAIERP